VDAGRETEQQPSDGGDTDDRPRSAAEGRDPAVCEEEAELLEGQPHEGEVEDAEHGVAGRDARRIHDHGSGDEQSDRPPRRALVRSCERRQQNLAEQEHGEEPQRLSEPVAGDADQIVGNARDQQGGERRADDGDREHGGQQQPVDACGRE